MDTLAGRPLYTPTVLGTAHFRRGAAVPLADVLPDFEMVWMFTWVHGLVFAAIGGVAVANMLAAAVMGGYFRLRHPSLSVRP